VRVGRKVCDPSAEDSGAAKVVWLKSPSYREGMPFLVGRKDGQAESPSRQGPLTVIKSSNDLGRLTAVHGRNYDYEARETSKQNS
jgi:hypothetical protein